MTFRILPAAQRELREATRWYTAKGTQTAAGFISDLRTCFQSLEDRPTLFPKIEGNRRRRDVRGLSLDQFPFRVIYEIRETEIIAVVPATGDGDALRILTLLVDRSEPR